VITPGQFNITIYTGASYELQVTLQDSAGTAIDLTDRTIRAEIWNPRRTTKLETFTVTKADSAKGILKLTLTPATTAGLPVDKAIATNKAAVIGAWDLQVTEPDTTTVYYWLEGTVSTNRGVTNVG
jgi:hypothetical protein